MHLQISRHLLWLCLALLSPFLSCIDDEKELETGTVELQEGDALPDFQVTMSDSTVVRTEDLRGQVSLIVFFHTQCPDCQAEFPILQRLYEECPYPFRMVSISRKESAASIQQCWKKNGWTFPYSAQNDARIYHLFASSRIPRIYVSDEHCIIRAIYTDSPIATYEELLTDIRNNLKK